MPINFLCRWKSAHCGENASILSREMSKQSGFLLIPIKSLKRCSKVIVTTTIKHRTSNFENECDDEMKLF